MRDIYIFLAGLICGMGIILVWKGLRLLADIKAAGKATEDALRALHGTARTKRPRPRFSNVRTACAGLAR